MSTPRRPCPRSSGAPMTATCCTATEATLTSSGHERRLDGAQQRAGADLSQLRVLLADDDASFLESLQPLIENQPERTVVGFAENGLHAIELADELVPDAVVIDLH